MYYIIIFIIFIICIICTNSLLIYNENKLTLKHTDLRHGCTFKANCKPRQYLKVQ